MENKQLIINKISEEFGVDNRFYNNGSRLRKYTYPRKALCIILRKYESMNLQGIAELLGLISHTSVIYHIWDGEGMYSTLDLFKDKMDRIYNYANQIYYK